MTRPVHRFHVRKLDAKRTVMATACGLEEAYSTARFFGDGPEAFEVYDLKKQEAVATVGGVS